MEGRESVLHNTLLIYIMDANNWVNMGNGLKLGNVGLLPKGIWPPKRKFTQSELSQKNNYRSELFADEKKSNWKTKM